MSAPGKSALIEVVRAGAVGWGISAVAVEPVYRGENQVFKVTADDDRRYAFRIHRPGYHTLDELRSERAWTQALRESGVSIVEPRTRPDGQMYGLVDLPGAGPCYAGMTVWQPGTTLHQLLHESADEEASRKAVMLLGETAARIHNHAASWRKPADFVRVQYDADGLMGDEPVFGRFWEVPELTPAQSKMLRTVRDSLHERLAQLADGPEAYGLINADLGPENVLIDGGELTVVDFDDAGFGWHRYELAAALLPLYGHPDFEALSGALITGYRQQRPLPDSALALLEMFLLIRCMVLLGWANERRDAVGNERVSEIAGQAVDYGEHYLELRG